MTPPMSLLRREEALCRSTPPTKYSLELRGRSAWTRQSTHLPERRREFRCCIALPLFGGPMRLLDLRPGGASMSDIDQKVEFEPVEMTPGLGWCVRVVLPTGKKIHLGDFNTEAEAREWIVRKSAAWFKLKECESRRGEQDARAPTDLDQ